MKSKKPLAVLMVLLSLLSFAACSAEEAVYEALEIADAVREAADGWEDCSGEYSPGEYYGETGHGETVYAESAAVAESATTLDPDGSYTTAEDVALYLHTYGCLPGNFITKSEAQKLGWSGGSLEPYAPGKCIGGDRFGNYEGLLPTAAGRSYTECDINTLGASSRGAERLIFSNDGLIYYTNDHYESFTLLYGED